MGKELYLEMYSRVNSRERLRIENIQLLANYAVLKFGGKETPPDMQPVELHILGCDLCQDDVAAFQHAMRVEEEAHMEYLGLVEDADQFPKQ